MSIFSFKKKEEKACCCSKGCESACSCNEKIAEECDVLILGSGCKKCNELEANTVVALEKMGLDLSIGHVKDFAKIATYGVMSTPAIVFKGKVLVFGKVLKPDEIVELIKKEI